MLAIDDMKKLAKMQEKLLERTVDDREVNLKKYKDTVKSIDEYSFSNLLSELDQLKEHNQTLENELLFLEQVMSIYEQVFEQQLSFRKIIELYGDNSLELSDLSQINIEYIKGRINTINGYLVNIKNIEVNKNKLQELNDKLIEEGKNKVLLVKRLLDDEKILRSNFISAEGRCIIDGQLQYVSVLEEYKKLGYDFKQLLEDTGQLDKLLFMVNNEKNEVEEKLKTAEICFNSVPNLDSKQIVDDIAMECIKTRYRLTMLKILQLLSKNYDNYDLFVEKREKLLDLIKYRRTCMDEFGIRVSIDPFARTKVNEQLDMILSMTDNSKNINKLMKQIASLSEMIEEMISQNNVYMTEINRIEDLFINKTSISDIDISSVYLDLEEYHEEKNIADNQVISVKVAPLNFYLDRAKQKSNSVVQRVNEMVSNVLVIEEEKEDVLTPELVIVSHPVEVEDEAMKYSNTIENDDEVISEVSLETENIDDVVSHVYDSDLFMTVDPFVETQLFTDRADESLEKDIFVDENSFSFVDLEKKSDDENIGALEFEYNEKSSESKEDNLELEYTEELAEQKEDNLDLAYKYDLAEDMPDAFWITQGETTSDKQISVLLADNNDVKTKKLVA